MQQTTEKKNNKGLILCILVIAVLFIALFVLGFYIISSKTASTQAKDDNKLTYDANVIVDDADSLQNAVDSLYEQVKEGHMVLEMKTMATSTDGTNFTCTLANAKENKYDMFMALYLDETQEEIYRSGLIPLGGKIEEFTTTKELVSGTHEATLVFNQVEEDKETIHAQVNVGLQLIVK